MFKSSGAGLFDLILKPDISGKIKSKESVFEFSTTTNFDNPLFSADIHSKIGRLVLFLKEKDSSKLIFTPKIAFNGLDLDLSLSDQSSFNLVGNLSFGKNLSAKVKFQSVEKDLQSEIKYQTKLLNSLKLQAFVTSTWQKILPNLRLELNTKNFQNSNRFDFSSQNLFISFLKSFDDFNFGASFNSKALGYPNIQGFLKFENLPLFDTSVLFNHKRTKNSLLFNFSLYVCDEHDANIALSVKSNIPKGGEQFQFSSLLNKIKVGFKSEVHPTTFVNGSFSRGNGFVLFVKPQLTPKFQSKFGFQFSKIPTLQSLPAFSFSFLFSDEGENKISIFE